MRSVIPGSEGELAAAGVGPVPGGRDGPPAGACSSDAGPVMPENAEIHLKKSMANTQKKSEGSPSTLFSEDASKPVSRVLSFKTAIYLDAPLPVRSSRLPGTVGPTACPSTALLRIEFTATGCSQPSGELLPHLSTLTCAFRPEPAVRQAVYLCCTFPRVAPGGCYPLSLPCGARTFLTGGPFAPPARLSSLLARL